MTSNSNSCPKEGKTPLGKHASLVKNFSSDIWVCVLICMRSEKLLTNPMHEWKLICTMNMQVLYYVQCVTSSNAVCMLGVKIPHAPTDTTNQCHFLNYHLFWRVFLVMIFGNTRTGNKNSKLKQKKLFVSMALPPKDYSRGKGWPMVFRSTKSPTETTGYLGVQKTQWLANRGSQRVGI